MKKTVAIVGAGRVGSALCKALYDLSYKISMVVSASAESALRLAEEVGAEWSDQSGILLSSDIIILAVPDTILPELAPNLNVSEKSIVLHTAGSFGCDVFKGLQCLVRGVLYPLQTFSLEREVKMADIPFLIESDSEEGLGSVRDIALDMSTHIYEMDTEKRQMLHVAAVMVSNFVNHLYLLGDDILGKENLPPGILDSLKKETLEKAIQLGPGLSQTGPAARNDILTIEKQRDLLSFSPEIRDIYIHLTESIIKRKYS